MNLYKAPASSIQIQVFSMDGGSTKAYGPNLLVVITNRSDEMLYLMRYIRAVEPFERNALRAQIIDLESGKYALTRYASKIILPPWQENLFVGVVPESGYGPIVDLRDGFILESGHKYRVRFTYSTQAPAKVGSIKPWKETAESDEIIVAVP